MLFERYGDHLWQQLNTHTHTQRNSAKTSCGTKVSLSDIHGIRRTNLQQTAGDKEIITVTGEVCAAVGGGGVYNRRVGVGNLRLCTSLHWTLRSQPDPRSKLLKRAETQVADFIFRSPLELH